MQNKNQQPMEAMRVAALEMQGQFVKAVTQEAYVPRPSESIHTANQSFENTNKFPPFGSKRRALQDLTMGESPEAAEKNAEKNKELHEVRKKDEKGRREE